MAKNYLQLYSKSILISDSFRSNRNYIITARKRSLRRLCFYRCLSVHRGGGVRVTWHARPPRQPRRPPPSSHAGPPPGSHARPNPPRQPRTPPPSRQPRTPPLATHAPPTGTHAPPLAAMHAPPPGSHARPPPAATHAPPPDTGNLHFHCRNTFFTSFFHIYID